MSYFEVLNEDLIRLTDEQLEKFIARLAEAEAASQGFSPSCVHWSGATDTPDGGVDVRVAAPSDLADIGFVPRPNSIFQAKTCSMPASRIAKEMQPDGTLAPAIAEQARNSGAYVIVCTKDDCTEPMKKSRIAAMRTALKGAPGANDIHLDFYDRSRLLQWLTQHPAVALWVRSELREPLSSWRPYGRWSNPPKDADDRLILKKGVTIILPSDRHNRLTIKDAITPLRELVRSSRKTIRIVGLSGVGKTRIVQALFDETIGDQPLDRTSAIYADLGADPVPSANAMLESLLAEGRTAFLVLDNCPTDVHGKLASRITSVNSNVRLITVEYDIRVDHPQETEVVHIEADGPDVAEELLIRRHPGTGPGNTHRIAGFADGNARVALAVAERVEAGESLAKLSDADLFDRLFSQRNEPDGQLRQHARLLALVYSFSVEESDADELFVLGSIQGISRGQLFSSVAELLGRQVAQKRSHWRAILPQAVANRLAADSLSRIPLDTLRVIFEAPGRERLLTSFAHRLGLLHDNDDAKSIVRSWLDEGGPLASVSNLNENGLMMLRHVAPTAPDAVLDRLAAEIEAPGFAATEQDFHSFIARILGLLTSLAYEPDKFDRCLSLLLRVAGCMGESGVHGVVGNKVVQFFQPYLSGTHASLDQRSVVLKEALNSDGDRRRSLGFRMLSTALDGPPWFGNGMNDFGARPRDYGFDPDRNQLAEWYSRFVDIAVEYGLHRDPELARQARQTLAQELRGLWALPELREKLSSAALKLNSQHAWTEGWQAVQKTIFFDYAEKNPDQNDEKIPPDLKQLAERLAPSDLMAKISTFVLGHDNDPWSLGEEFHEDEPNGYDEATNRLTQRATDLGQEFACSGRSVTTLGTRLFSSDYMPYRCAFGRGLAASAYDKAAMWDDLVNAVAQMDSENCDLAVLAGYIEQVDSEDRSYAQCILDQCLEDATLNRELVYLHPAKTFDKGDLDRCMNALDVSDAKVWRYGDFFWKDPYASLPLGRLQELTTRILAKPAGEDVVLQALAMKLHGESPNEDVLGIELRRLGLIAATNRLLNNRNDPGGRADHHMQRVLRASLSFGGNDQEKSDWLDAIFDVVDSRRGMLNSFNRAVRLTAELMPGEFLDRVFVDDDERRQWRYCFIERETLGKPVLSDVEASNLIAWCEARNDPKAWRAAASGLHLWDSTDADETARLSDTAVRFLEASPFPEDTLMTYARKISPRSWMGSRADIIERGIAFFSILLQHRDPRISVRAREIVREATKQIEFVRHQEHLSDGEREQRFE